MKKSKLTLKEDLEDELEFDLPALELEEPIDEIPLEDTLVDTPEEVVTNAYSDIAQDVLRKQWDVINACDGLIATLTAEENTAFDKEDVLAVLHKITDETTETIGMTTKALGVIDPSQEELMKDGVEDAEEAIEDAKEEKPTEVQAEEEPKEDELDEALGSGITRDEAAEQFFTDCIDTLIYNGDLRRALNKDEQKVFDRLCELYEEGETDDYYAAFYWDSLSKLLNSGYLEEIVEDMIVDSVKSYISANGDAILSSEEDK